MEHPFFAPEMILVWGFLVMGGLFIVEKAVKRDWVPFRYWNGWGVLGLLCVVLGFLGMILQLLDILWII